MSTEKRFKGKVKSKSGYIGDDGNGRIGAGFTLTF